MIQLRLCHVARSSVNPLFRYVSSCRGHGLSPVLCTGPSQVPGWQTHLPVHAVIFLPALRSAVHSIPIACRWAPWSHALHSQDPGGSVSRPHKSEVASWAQNQESASWVVVCEDRVGYIWGLLKLGRGAVPPRCPPPGSGGWRTAR